VKAMEDPWTSADGEKEEESAEEEKEESRVEA